MSDFDITGHMHAEDDGSVSKINQEIDGVGQSAGGLNSILTGVATGFTTAFVTVGLQAIGSAASALEGFVGDSLKASRDQTLVLNQLNSVLKSTHGAAGVTADEAKHLADALSDTTKFSDDTVTSAENMLLTFTNIKDNVFPDATKTVLDMSQALGQDTKSSAIQLGKALNDPIKGITALSRVGVTFNAQQKTMIANMVKAGNVAGAQKVILKELATEFGGSAEAAATPWDKLSNKMEKFKATVGDALTPAIDVIGTSLLSLGDKVLPLVSSVLTNTVAPALKIGADTLSNFIDNVSAGDTPLDALGKAMWQAGVPPETIQSVQDFIKGIQDAIAKIGDFIKGVGDFVTNVGKVPAQIQAFFAGIGATAGQLAAIFYLKVNEIATNISTQFQAIGKSIQTSVTQWVNDTGTSIAGFVGKGADIVNNIKTGISSVSGTAQAISVQDWISSVGSQIAGFVGKGAEIVSNIQSGISTNIANISTDLQAGFNQAVTDISDAIAPFVGKGSEIITNITAGLNSMIGNVGSELAKGPAGWITDLEAQIGGFVTAGANIIAGLVSGISQHVGDVTTAIVNACSGALKAALHFLGIGSPSKVFAEVGLNTMRGFAVGINAGHPLPVAAMLGVAPKVIQASTGGPNISNANRTNIYNFGPNQYRPAGTTAAQQMSLYRP